MISQLNVLATELGELPAKALERPDAIEDFKARYANRAVATTNRWIRILKENSKTELARVIPFEPGSRLEKLLRRRTFLGPDAFVFGEATT